MAVKISYNENGEKEGRKEIEKIMQHLLFHGRVAPSTSVRHGPSPTNRLAAGPP